jgi:uncharacterized protein YndB with AHSA1/START domain
LAALLPICVVTCANALWRGLGLTRCFVRFRGDGRGVNRGQRALTDGDWCGRDRLTPSDAQPENQLEDAYDGVVPVDVVTSVEIDRPRAEVAAFASDPDNATSWYQNIMSVEWRTNRPVEVGSRVDFVATFLGRRLAYTYEVLELAPGRRLVMSTSEGPFPMETSYVWEDLPSGGTRMTLRNRGEPSGFTKVAAPAMSQAMRRANRKDLARLKHILEQ